ncbi:MAG: type II secretion system F family protein [Firmicutes bacterium]|nr:type II secretion system F family protein [Bacillota bacterium]
MAVLIAFAGGLTVASLFILLYTSIFQKKYLMEDRLNKIQPLASENPEDDEFRKSFLDRVGTPIYQKFLNFLARMTPQSMKDNYENIIYQSGNYKKMTTSNILAQQFVVSFLMLIIFGAVFIMIGFLNPLYMLLIAIIGFLLPYFQLRTKAKNRALEIQNKLPDILDLLYVSVEAGLGFDMSMKRATDKIKGELSNELKWALDDISKGKEREEALRAVYKRTGVEDLNSFITAIIQAEQLGSNIANMLRIQSNMLRQKRKQRAEEKSMKLPIKMIFPLLFFMFPAIFIVILGPAALNAMDSLKGIL